MIDDMIEHLTVDITDDMADDLLVDMADKVFLFTTKWLALPIPPYCYVTPAERRDVLKIQVSSQIKIFLQIIIFLASLPSWSFY